MIAMQLSEACRAVGGSLLGGDAAFAGVSTDTRAQLQGKLFVALRGDRFDAHDFLDTAVDQGAAGLLLDRPLAETTPRIVVPDTRAALGALAQAWRGGFTKPLVAITGSNGKTTVKQMCASILSHCGQVHATAGNFNNDIGVPLTLFGLEQAHDYAVIEMGANHPGEIANLVAMAQPDAAVITNAGPAHLEGFGDLPGVARSKGEIFAGLPEGATAVINADDDFAPLWRELAAPRQVVEFGLQAADADVGARILESGFGTRLCLITPQGEIDLNLPLAGRHNVLNALAASALCMSVGAGLTAVKQGLESVRNVGGRLKRHQDAARGLDLIDDSYNANPASVKAGIDLLVNLAAEEGGEAWLVLGDMAELGADAAELHADLGVYAKQAGVTRLLALGDLSREAVSRFGDGGLGFDTHAAVAEHIESSLTSADGVHVLVKGSRSMRMEKVVDALLGNSSEVTH